MGSNSFLSTNCHAQLALRPPQRHHPWQNGASLRHQLWIDLEWTSLLGHQCLGRNNAWTACCWLPLLHSCRAGHHSQCPHFLLNLRAVDRHTFVIESLSLFKNRLQVSNVMKKNKNEIHLQQCAIWKSKMNLKKKVELQNWLNTKEALTSSRNQLYQRILRGILLRAAKLSLFRHCRPKAGRCLQCSYKLRRLTADKQSRNQLFA